MTAHVLIFTGSFIVALSGAMMPGPMLTATIGEVMKRGFRAGPLIVLGHGLLEVVLLAGLVVGLDAWLMRHEVKVFMGVLGGATLVLMGLHMAWTSRAAVDRALHAEPDPRAALRGPVLAGILTSLANPYWTIWWATIGLGYALVSLERGMSGLTSFFAGHILGDLAWYGVVAAAVAGGRRLCPPRVYRVVLVGCGIVLLGLGAWFVAWGLRSHSGAG